MVGQAMYDGAPVAVDDQERLRVWLAGREVEA
jgi:hypothetical protein